MDNDRLALIRRQCKGLLSEQPEAYLRYAEDCEQSKRAAVSAKTRQTVAVILTKEMTFDGKRFQGA
jgi:hypothetical protein